MEVFLQHVIFKQVPYHAYIYLYIISIVYTCICTVCLSNLGEKIAELLQKSGGDFSAVELHIKRTHEKETSNTLEGEYVTEIDLIAKGWEPDMIEFSKNYAISKGNLRKSEIHGRDEWKLPLKESFKFKAKNREIVEAEAAAEIEDWFCLIFIHVDQTKMPSSLEPPAEPGY